MASGSLLRQEGDIGITPGGNSLIFDLDQYLDELNRTQRRSVRSNLTLIGDPFERRTLARSVCPGAAKQPAAAIGPGYSPLAFVLSLTAVKTARSWRAIL